MNLQQTIDELEKQAAQYTEAANTLRELQRQNGGNAAASQPGGARKAAAKKSAAKSGKGGGRGGRGRKKGPVSAETRAKISEALRAAHAARKANAGKK